MKHLNKNIAANYLGQGWVGFMAVAFLPLYIEYLGVEAYGLIGLFAVLQALVVILDMGIGNTINREMAAYAHGRHSPHAIRNLLHRLEIACYIAAAAVLTAGWLFSGFLTRDWLRTELLPANEVAYALVLMALVAALRLCEGLYRGALYGLEDQVWYNLMNSTVSTLRYVGALGVLVFVSPTIKAFFLWQTSVSIVMLATLLWRVYKLLPPPDKGEILREPPIKVLKYASGVIGIASLTMIFLQLDKILLSRLVSLKELGYYTLAATAANVIFMLIIPVTQAVFPRLVKTVTDGDRSEMVEIYRKTTKLVVVLTACASMLLYFYSEGVVHLWSGNPELVKNSAPLLSILALGSFLNGLSYLPHQLQIATGRTALLLATNAVVLLIYLPMILVAIPSFGVQGAAWIWVGMNAGYLLSISFLVHWKMLPNQKWHWCFFDVLLPTVGAAATMLLAKAVQPGLNAGRDHWLVFLCVTGLIAVAVSAGIATFNRANDANGGIENT